MEQPFSRRRLLLGVAAGSLLACSGDKRAAQQGYVTSEPYTIEKQAGL